MFIHKWLVGMSYHDKDASLSQMKQKEEEEVLSMGYGHP